MSACSVCGCIIGDEVAYGDTWDGRPVCIVCAHEPRMAGMPLYIHMRLKCKHEWTEEVVFEQGASAKCGKCGQLSINEDWAG